MLSIPHHVRRLIFFVLVCCFTVTAGLVIFHTFGYRYSNERGIFIYTGSLTLATNPPSGLQITINGEPIPHSRSNTINNSIHVTGLLPGEHLVEVTAPDYQSWSKKVVIESGRSTEFWNIQLARQEPVLSPLAGTEYARSLDFGPENNQLILVKERQGEYTVDLYHTENETGEQIFSSASPVVPTLDKPFLWSPNGRSLLIPLDNPQAPYAVVDVRTRESRLLALDLPAGPLSHFRFDPTTQNLVFFLQGTTLYRLDIQTGDTLPARLASNVATFEISGRSLYFVESQSGIVYRVPVVREAFNPVQLTREPLPLATFGREADFRLGIYDEDRFAVLEENTGRLFVHNRYAPVEIRELPAQGVRGMQFSDDGKKLLYHTDHEILVYFVREWEVQPQRAADTLHQIARFSDNIRHVTWNKNYENVLFTLGSDLKVIELDPRDHRNILDVARFDSEPEDIVTDFADNLVFVAVPSVENQPSRIEAIDFPEPTGFFNF